MKGPDATSATSLAPRRVPEAYLRAEVAAFPLVGEQAFRTALTSLDPALPRGSPTTALWRACEDTLVTHTGWSLDRLVAARDQSWFDVRAQTEGRPQHTLPMHLYLRQLAEAHLVARAGVTRFAEPGDISQLDRAGQYRWLTFAIPEDLLLSALDVSPPAVRVDTDPQLLVRRLLDRGVAEIHQHVGAGMDFPLLWASALEAILSPDVTTDALSGPGAPLGDGKELVQWLLAAAIMRVALAEHLLREGGSREPRSFRELVNDTPARVRGWTPLRRGAFRDVIRALASGAGPLPETSTLRDLYTELHPTAAAANGPPTSLAEAHKRCDPVAARLHFSGAGAGERWLVREGLAHLDRTSGPGGPRDPLFEALFWQVIRVRCLVYRAIVERPLTAGLQWFVRFYDRIGHLGAPLRPFRVETSFHVAGSGQPILAMELRTSARQTATGVGEDLLQFVRSYRRVLEGEGGHAGAPELGVIYHFIKKRDASKAWDRGAPPAYWQHTLAEPAPETDRGGSAEHAAEGRYLGFFRDQARTARAIARVLWEVPSALQILRGIDVASDELGVPTWALVPLFRHLVDVGAAVSPVARTPPLGVTAHVGEDFRHLMEGMRRIDEHVSYILCGAPGRLGHAVALGIQPRAWASSAGSVTMPAEERLWDLVWEWRLYSRHHVRLELAAIAPPSREGRLREAILEVSELVFERPCEPRFLADAHHTLHRFLLPSSGTGAMEGGLDVFSRALARLRSPHGHLAPETIRILSEHLFDEGTFRRGQALVDVAVDEDEVAAMDAVQRALRRAISDAGIVVEVNPSSNLLIGDLLDLRHHPVLRLCPPEPEEGAPPPVAIALGSDDPVTFSTRLVREYSLLYDAARAAGYSEPAVVAWLDTVRQTSLDARFTFAWRPDPRRVAADLERDLAAFLRLPRMEPRRASCGPGALP